MSDELKEHWENQTIEAAYAFAQRCAKFRDDNPDAKTVLTRIMNDLMTELWDNGFSQSEIRKAFEEALRDMPRYAAGEERRR